MRAKEAWEKIERLLTDADPDAASGQLEIMKLELGWYAEALSNDGPRVSKIDRQFAEAHASAKALRMSLMSIRESIENLPDSWKLPNNLAAWTDFSADDSIDDAMSAIHFKIESSRKQFAAMVGADRGGKGRSAASVFAGGPKLRLARSLAPTFEYFFGAPTGTVDGAFHRFVLLAHEAATGKEGAGFEDAIKRAAKELRIAVETREKIENRIEQLSRRIYIYERQLYAANFYKELDVHPRTERAQIGVYSIRARIRRLLSWSEHRDFPARPKQTGQGG